MTLALPDYLPEQAAATTQHGRRVIAWTITDPGEIHRNQYRWARIAVTEREPWKGEPLWLSAQRRTSPTSHIASSFTDKARDRMHTDIVPVVARRGFTAMWLDLHRSPSRWRSAEQARAEADDAALVVEWWRAKAELLDMHTDGLLDFLPVERVPLGEHPVTVRVCRSHDRQWTHEHPVAAAFLDGEQVGWMLDSGELVPTEVTR